jgi:PAS domain S-box-containing protein
VSNGQVERVLSPCEERPAASRVAHFADLYEEAPLAYLVLDDEARVEEINRAGTELLGWNASWLAGRDLRTWILPDDSCLFAGHLQAAFAAGAARQSLRLKTRSGQIRDVLLETRSARDPQGVRRLLVIVIDISEHRRGERAARAEQAKLLHADRLGMMGEMASSLAHELNQPLGAILLNSNACLQMLRRGAGGGDARLGATLDRICESATYAGDIIRHLRRFLRAAEPEHRSMDLNALILDAMRMMEADALDHDMTIRLELVPSLPPVVGDAVQIEQVLLNLVRNGMDAMTNCVPRQITVRSARLSEDQVAFSVSDVGPGISAQAANHLFDPLFTTKAGGMGLGLSISRTIVEAHRGRLWWDCEATPGATFLCSLPIGTAASP